MSANVEVFTVSEDVDLRHQQDGSSRFVANPFHVDEAVAAGAGNPSAEEPLVEAMKSLRDQLDRLESTYDMRRNHANAESKAASHTRGVESSHSRFTSSGDAADSNKSPDALNGNGNISGSILFDSSLLKEEVPRSTPQQTTLTPSRRMLSSSTVQNGISGPVRNDPSVITEDPSLRSERLSTRTPLRSTPSSRPVNYNASNNDHRSTGYLPSSATKPRSGTTPYRSLHSPSLPTTSANLLGTPTTTPFSAQKSVNQSFVSYLEPEPVQTPNPSMLGGGARGLNQSPELYLLDSLVGTVEALRKRLDEQELRMERMERSNVILQEEVRYLRSEASKWQFQNQLERELRAEERRAFSRRREEVPELHRRHRSRGRNEGLRDSPREHSHSDLQREESRSANLRGYRETPTRRVNGASPGGVFVEELCEKLPLDTDQYEVLVSLMNRYFVEEANAGRRGP